MAISRAALTTAFTNMNFGFAPSPVEQALINSYADQTVLSGGLTNEQALLATTQLVGDTTAVAALTYQFFTGSIPSQAGFFYLVNSEGNGDLNPNVNDLNDPYYNSFNQENRYYNFALNLATAPAGATFRSIYTGLSVVDTVTVAYETIIGTANAINAGFNPTAAKADIVARAPTIRAQIVQRLGLADNAANNAAIELAYRAGIVAYILNEAFKASVGNYADALELFLIDISDNGLADSSVDGNGFGGNLLAEYPGVDDAREFTLTAGADAGAAFTGGSGDDTYFATQATLGSTDVLNGGAGDDTLTLATSGAGPVTLAGFDTTSIETFLITSDATFGTTVDVSGMEDLEQVTNTNSSRSLTLTGMVPTINVTIENTTQGPTLPVNTTIQYIAAATAGDNTMQQITLNNVIDPVDLDGQTTINLTGNADGVEIVNLIVSGDNILNGLESNGLDEVNITGTGDITFNTIGFDNDGLLNAVNLSGVLTAVINTSPGLDIEVRGGSGDDVIDFRSEFTTGDSFDGNGGSDLLIVNGGDLTDFPILDGADTEVAGPGGLASDVETVTVEDGGLNGMVNMANLGAALTTFNVNTALFDTTFRNLLSTTTVVVDDAQALLINETLTVDFVGDNANDIFNLTINNIGDGFADTQVNIADDNLATVLDQSSLNTINLVANGGATGDLLIDFVGLAELTRLNLTANADIVFQTPGAGQSGALATIVGTGNRNVNLTNLEVSGAGVSITLGGGNDVVGGGFGTTLTDSMDGNDTVNAGAGNDIAWGGLGNDTLNGEGGNDTLAGQQGTDVINGGAGTDTINGGFGADTLTGGANADTFVYTDIQDSQAALIDTITDFEVGSDFIQLIAALSAANPLVLDASDVTFVGNVDSQLQGETALIGGGNVGAFYVRSNNTLYIDVDGNGDIDIDDMVIVVNTVGEADLTAASIGANFAPVTYTAAVVGFDTSNPTNSIEGSVTTAANDTINTTFARLAGATVNGQGGLDVLNITDRVNLITTLETYASIRNIDRLALRGGSSDLVTAPDINGLVITLGADSLFATFNDLSVAAYGQTVQGSAAADVITLNNELDQAFGRTGDDTINVVDAGPVAVVVDAGDGADTVFISGATSFVGGSISGGNGDTDTDELILGDGADISGATVSAFEIVTFVDDATMTTAQHNALEPLFNTNANPGNEITIVDGGVLTTSTVIESYVFTGNFVNTVTLGDNDTDVDLGDGNDVLRTNGFGNFPGTTFQGGLGTDTFQVTGASTNLTTGADVAISGFEVLGLDNNLDITMSNVQHNSFTSANGVDDVLGDNEITIVNSFTGTTFNTIEVYNLDNTGGTHNFSVGASVTNQVINNNDTSDGQSVSIGSGTSGVTYNSNTAAATTYTATSGSTNLTLNLGGDADSLTFGGTHTGLLVQDISGGIDTVTLQNNTSLSGALNFSPLDRIIFGTGINLTGLTVTGLTDVTYSGAGTYTLSEQVWENTLNTGTGAFSGAALAGVAGSQTIAFTNTVSTTAQTSLGQEIENYQLNSAGNDSITFFLNSLLDEDYDVSLAGGGTDTVRLVNTHDANLGRADLDIAGFGAGVGGDLINWDDDGVNIGVTFQGIVANSNSTLTGSNGALLEVTTASINVAGSTDVSVSGVVEGVIAAAVGDMTAGTFVAGDNLGFILYDANGNAYLYSVDLVTVDTDLQAGDFTVELVGVVAGVGVDGLSGANFI